MKISLIKTDKIIDFTLPPQIHGNYWVIDKNRNGKDRNFINIVANNGRWQMMSNYEVSIFDGEKKDSVDLELDKFYTVKVEKEDDALIYCTDAYNSKNVQLTIKKEAEVYHLYLIQKAL